MNHVRSGNGQISPAVKRYATPLDLQVLEFVEVRKQFLAARLYNLPAQPLACEELKTRQFPLEKCPLPSLEAIPEVLTD